MKINHHYYFIELDSFELDSILFINCDSSVLAVEDVIRDYLLLSFLWGCNDSYPESAALHRFLDPSFDIQLFSIKVTVSFSRAFLGKFFFTLRLYSRLSRKISASLFLRLSMSLMKMKSSKKKCSIKNRIAIKVTCDYCLGGLNCFSSIGGWLWLDDYQLSRGLMHTYDSSSWDELYSVYLVYSIGKSASSKMNGAELSPWLAISSS